MTHNENHIIQKFINGTLDEISRNKISEKVKNFEISDEKNNMNNKSQKFNADTAWEHLLNKITVQQTNKLTAKNKVFYKFGKIAASVLLLLGLSISGYFIFNSTLNIQSENKLKIITLPDGSRITLNTNSHLSYPKRFAETDRTVEFDGEAFFNISKNIKKPFIIKTQKAQIKVLGTSFNINTENKNTEVVVETGKVEFKSILTNQSKVVLIPGEKGILNAEKLYKIKNNNPNYLSWKTHIFTYENELLKTIVSDINKAYQVNISFENPEIGNIITGKTSFHNYKIETIINIICETHHLKSSIKGKNITLSY